MQRLLCVSRLSTPNACTGVPTLPFATQKTVCSVSGGAAWHNLQAAIAAASQLVLSRAGLNKTIMLTQHSMSAAADGDAAVSWSPGCAHACAGMPALAAWAPMPQQ